MHEMAIAVSLVDVAVEEAAREGGARVSALHVRVGKLSGVVPAALQFAFEAAASESEIAGAKLVIEEMPVVVMCDQCDAERELPGIQDFRCPVCGGSATKIVGGRELQLYSIEVDDDCAEGEGRS